MNDSHVTLKTAIVYHFFADYRRPINEYLNDQTNDDYVFVGDRVNRVSPGTPVWSPSDRVSFIGSRGYRIARHFLVQPRVLLLPFDRKLDTIIYLGDWKFLTTWISAICGRLMGKRILFWTHGWLAPEAGLKGFIRRSFYRLAHGLLLYGNVARRIGIDEGFPKDRMYVVFNSLDYADQKKIRESVSDEQITRLRQQLFPEPERPVLILVGRLSKAKRVDLLIRAAAQLDQKGHPVNVLIVGDGEDKQALVDLAESNGVSANFYGTCHDEEQVGRLLMCADVTVCPAAAGLTVTHSLTFGVPVVAGDNMSAHGPEVEAIIPGDTGAFFEDGNLDSLVATIRELVFAETSVERSNCFRVVDQFYNPEYQATVIQRAIRLQPALEADLTQAVRAA